MLGSLEFKLAAAKGGKSGERKATAGARVLGAAAGLDRQAEPPGGRQMEDWLSDPVSRFVLEPPRKYGSKEFIANAREVMWVRMEGTAPPHGIWNRVAIEYMRDKQQSVPEQVRTPASSTWHSPTRVARSGMRSTRQAGGTRGRSYPSGISGYSGAAGEMLSYLFPADEEMWRKRAMEAGMSRFWGGVHWKEGPRRGAVVREREIRAVRECGRSFRWTKACVPA